MEKADYIIVGKVGSAYGVKGWVKVLSYTEWTATILDYSPWYIENNAGWQRIVFTEGREHGKGIIVHFDGIDSPEKARLLSGKNIAILRSQLPALKKDEFYWSDLEGLTVVNQEGITLGKVIYLIATGSNDVLVVKGEKEIAIPYLPDVVLDVDLTTRTITVNWELL